MGFKKLINASILGGVMKMCGRYTITISLDELYEIYQMEVVGIPDAYKPRYNVAAGSDGSGHHRP
jgi:hypothetical protein